MAKLTVAEALVQYEAILAQSSDVVDPEARYIQQRTQLDALMQAVEDPQAMLEARYQQQSKETAP